MARDQLSFSVFGIDFENQIMLLLDDLGPLSILEQVLR